MASLGTVFLSKRANKIGIDVRNNKELLEGDHRLTLKLLGFTALSSGNGYEIVTKNPDTVIRQITDYLKKFGYEIESDPEMSKDIENFAGRIEVFGKARISGMRIKEQKTHMEILPPNFNPVIKIKPYQKKPIQHMLEVGYAANFSVPGSGKTLMTYAVYDILKQEGAVDSLFVVGPISSFGPWEDEYKMCMKNADINRTFRYLGNDRHTKLRDLGNYDVILTSYGTASNDASHLKEYLFANKKVMMVIDESHHIKRFDDDATYANSMIDLGKAAERRYVLSGTPIPHGFEDLWSQITFLWPYVKMFGSRQAYKNLLSENNPETKISEQINFLWTRVTNKHLKNDMPQILEPETISVPMSENQEAIYTDIERDIWTIMQHSYFDKQSLLTFRKNRILRLLQSVTNPNTLRFEDVLLHLDKFDPTDSDLNSRIMNYSETPPKVTKAAKLALEIAKNENVVVWTVFVKNVDMLRTEIKKLDPSVDPILISGEIPTDSDHQKDVEGREDRLRRFKEGRCQILVATVGSIAESISMHRACRRAIYLERNFNAGQYMQSLSRIYRIGADRTKPVKFIFLRSVFSDGVTGTVDGKVNIVLNQRIRQLHELLSDEFKLHPLDLDTSSYAMRKSASPDESKEAEAIYDNVVDMLKEHDRDGKL